MNKPTDILLIKKGDEHAFVEMYHLLNRRVFNYFLKKTGQTDVAKDLTQQCFIRLYHYRESLSEQHPLEKQVYIIAKSILINHIRLENRRKLRDTNYSKEQSDVESYSHFEVSDYLEKIIVKLSPVRKKIILLKVHKGLSNKEIAEELSISVKTVENHITKAHQHMRVLSAELVIVFVILVC
ncbi:RNA polymerase sigma-70 factor, ECF subfamily [Chitinophaga sp. CF118]|uniref:RNA polymerase sigma factor n=1 Tax=Chitinophaga sp. CF118 TaxID=1884367 RepID=UPI0008DF9800|nr:sigma-70 family RNA polymerase sigma factor [Chitinophaga sp. CF118]SFD47831.1 RNA polymerase sigma-70 factor, ECF subfamily [Chitinophaga sp. CF118]